jgi:hypothetical protein
MKKGVERNLIIGLLAAILVVGIIGIFFSGSSLTGKFVAGDGTSSNPYQITNCLELQDMNSDLSANYVLMNNIDCSDTINWNGGEGFVPIGNVQNGFEGSFDGQGYEISNLYINIPVNEHDSVGVGLFGVTSDVVESVVLENVNLVNFDIHGEHYVGTLVGYLAGGLIQNVHASGVVKGESWLGGLAGTLSPGTIFSCSFDGEVNHI